MVNITSGGNWLKYEVWSCQLTVGPVNSRRSSLSRSFLRLLVADDWRALPAAVSRMAASILAFALAAVVIGLFGGLFEPEAHAYPSSVSSFPESSASPFYRRKTHMRSLACQRSCLVLSYIVANICFLLLIDFMWIDEGMAYPTDRITVASRIIAFTVETLSKLESNEIHCLFKLHFYTRRTWLGSTSSLILAHEKRICIICNKQEPERSSSTENTYWSLRTRN